MPPAPGITFRQKKGKRKEQQKSWLVKFVLFFFGKLALILCYMKDLLLKRRNWWQDNWFWCVFSTYFDKSNMCLIDSTCPSVYPSVRPSVSEMSSLRRIVELKIDSRVWRIIQEWAPCQNKFKIRLRSKVIINFFKSVHNLKHMP